MIGAIVILIFGAVAIGVMVLFCYAIYRLIGPYIRYNNRTILNTMKLINEEAKTKGLDDGKIPW